MNARQALALLSLAALLVAAPVQANDDDAEDAGLSYPVAAGALALGTGGLALLGGGLALGAGVVLYTSPSTFVSEDNTAVLISQALLVAGGMGLGLGVCLTGAGAGTLVSHTFFE